MPKPLLFHNVLMWQDAFRYPEFEDCMCSTCENAKQDRARYGTTLFRLFVVILDVVTQGGVYQEIFARPYLHAISMYAVGVR